MTLENEAVPPDTEGVEFILEKRPTAGAVRTCVVTRQEMKRELLIRFVLDPHGRLMEDLAGRLTGRAVYVTPGWSYVATLLKRTGLLRSLGKGGVQLPEASLLQQRLADGLLQRWQEGIGLARRAGSLRKGMTELEEALGKGGRPLVLMASDTAVNTRQKMASVLYKHNLQPPLELMDRDVFGSVCGQEGPVAVLTITSEGLARRVRYDSQRWIAYSSSIH